MTPDQLRDNKKKALQLKLRAKRSGIRVINRGKTYLDVQGRMIKMAREIRDGLYGDVTAAIFILKGSNPETRHTKIISTCVGAGNEADQVLMLEMAKKGVLS